MTDKLYINDSYVKECNAEVLSCTKTEDAYDVILSQTVFYPEGGGQPYDTGYIDDIPVIAVYEQDARILHKTAAPLPVGKTVHAKIDWARRFDHMQQHSGEHLLSFAAKELFSATNIGFHMSAEYCTVDFDMPFTIEQLNALERRANELIYQDILVELKDVDAETLNENEVRKIAKGLSGIVRLVYMQGGDSCTCCGTHVNRTGEIGSLKITASERYKGGERITFSCGARAVAYAQHMQDIVDALSRKFSCKASDIKPAVEKMQQELSSCKQENKALYTRLGAYIKKELLEGAELVGKYALIVSLVEFPASHLRPIALSLAETSNALILLCAQSKDQLQYLLCASKSITLHMGELIEAVNAALAGKGGGRGNLAQGSAKYTPGAQEALLQLQNYFVQRLKACR